VTSALQDLMALTDELLRRKILLNRNIRISFVENNTKVRVWVQGDQFRQDGDVTNNGKKLANNGEKVFRALPDPETGKTMVGEGKLKKIGNLRLTYPETGEPIQAQASVVGDPEIAIQAACRSLCQQIREAYKL